MVEVDKRLEKLEKYQDRVVASIKELNSNNIELQERVKKLEDENEKLRDLLNANGTNIIIEQAKRETEIKRISEAIEKMENKPSCSGERNERVDMVMPTFYGNQRNLHPKKFLAELERYMEFKKIQGDDQMIIVENALKNKAASWFMMMKYASPNFEKFKDLFLKQYFSETHQWDIFIQCTEAGKRTIQFGYQEHFHYWMTQLKYLNMPRMEEGQAINLITKHFPISVQAYVQNCTEKKFISIWEKLGEVEPKPNNRRFDTKPENRNERLDKNRNGQLEDKIEKVECGKKSELSPNKRINNIHIDDNESDEENENNVKKNEERGIADQENWQY